MLAASIPPKFSIPFAGAAGSADIRSIPVGSQKSIQPGAASLSDGFPPLNFVAIAAGGIPPFGQDMNGILNQVTLWNQWHAAGGPIKFDANFAAAIGGYPAGGRVQSNSGHAIYESLQDNNTADPNTGSVLWRLASCVWSTTAVQATGSANIQIITLTPAPTSLAQMIGIPITVLSQGTNTGPVSLNSNGFGALPVQASGGVPLSSGALNTGVPFTVIPTGSAFILTSGLDVYTDATNQGLVVDGSSNSNGANLLLRGNGVTTPNKYMRAAAGVLQFLNSAYTAAIATLSDVGGFSTQGPITAITGNITSSAGNLIANLGAFGTGNPHAGVLLGDFTTNGSNWRQAADGFIIQWGSAIIPVSGNSVTLNLNKVFATTGYLVIPQAGAFSPQPSCQVGGQAATIAQFAVTATSPTNTGTIGINWLALGF